MHELLLTTIGLSILRVFNELCHNFEIETLGKKHSE